MSMPLRGTEPLSWLSAVFAPTNAAFQALEANLGYTPEQLLAAPILAPILKYHVVPGVAAQVMQHHPEGGAPRFSCVHAGRGLMFTCRGP